MATRWLLRAEGHVAFAVFQHTVPYLKVRVTDKLGIGNAPYTVNSGTGEDARFYLNVGRDGYLGMHRELWLRQLLIHELTHVWQGYHSAWTPSFIFNSLWHQTKSWIAGKGAVGAYRYTLGQRWEQYNVEQQASIVEDWYYNGQSQTDALYPYIRDHIRKATPAR